MEALAEHHPDLVITDLYLDKTKAYGMEILQKARALIPSPACLMMTGFGSVESAVEAMRLGAYDFLENPFKLDELKLSIQRALNYTRTVAENALLLRELKQRYGFHQIIGAAPRMQEVFRMIERVADTDATVLILGESGTGKELVARALHFNSRRQHAAFVPINCSALPENLLESELFGHRKGAFTGAINDKNGLFHEADGGTIFLDEIGTMPAQLQSRLLRVLQEREIRRVGDTTAVAVNVRVLAATNENLEKLVKEGKFREDLFYRLNVVPISMPAQRERVEDIPVLVYHFLRDKVHSRTGQPCKISRRALDALCLHDWPGNVRELENAIERASVLSESPLIVLRDLPPVIIRNIPVGESDQPETALVAEFPDGSPGYTRVSGTPPPVSVSPKPGTAMPSHIVSLKRFIRDQETAYLNHVLTLTNQNKEEAARLLDISLATLYRKVAGEGE